MFWRFEKNENLIVGSSARAGGMEPELADLAKLNSNCKSIILVIIIIILVVITIDISSSSSS